MQTQHKKGELHRTCALICLTNARTACVCVRSASPRRKFFGPRLVSYLRLKLRVIFRENSKRPEGNLVVRVDYVGLIEPFRPCVLCVLADRLYDGGRRFGFGGGRFDGGGRLLALVVG